MSNFLSIANTKEDIVRKNLFWVIMIFWFTWIVFHFTVVFFFWLVLQSIFLVWIFLWLWNFVALLIDIPMWLIQKYFEPKKILIFSWIVMLLTWLIFVKFIYLASVEWLFGSFMNWHSLVESWIKGSIIIFNSWINIFLLVLAAAFYGIIKESFDVTILSYIFDHSDPSEYAKMISRTNISFWIWAFIWLLSSWVILAFDISNGNDLIYHGKLN